MSGPTFNNPFAAPGRWRRGDLHLHTTNSDGRFSPADAVAWFRRHGFDFVAITDHGKVTPPPEAPPGMLLIPGAEYATSVGDTHWHLVSIAPTGAVTGDKGPLEELYASVRDHSAWHFLAHPYWSNMAEEDLLAFADCPAVEAYNGSCEPENREYSEPAWDYALSAGRRMNGLCVDDAHRERDLGTGWVMVKSERLDRDAIIDSLRRGRYYSSCGPELLDFRVEGTKAGVKCSPCRSVKFITDGFLGENCFSEAGGLLESASHEMTGRERWLRVQVEDERGRRAYTNPVYFEA